MVNIDTIEDYNLLKRISGNRQLNPLHIRKLEESIKKNPEDIKFTPILINERNEIIDGQHRFEAVKRLGLPVYAIKAKGMNLSDVVRLNSISKTWTPIDYARSYSEKGYYDYQVYLEIKQKYNLTHSVLVMYLTLTPNKGILDGFKDGLLKIKDRNKSEKLIQELVEINKYYKYAKETIFATALLKAQLHSKYDHKRMVNKISLNVNKIDKYAMVEDALRLLEKIYNDHLAPELKVRFF